MAIDRNKLEIIRKKHYDEWITISGAHVEVGEDGELKGPVGEAISEKTGENEKISKAQQDKLNKEAEKYCKKMGISTQKIDGQTHILFNKSSMFLNGSKKDSTRTWAAVVDKSDKKYIGNYGNFEIYSQGYWGPNDNESFGYDCVLKK